MDQTRFSDFGYAYFRDELKRGHKRVAIQTSNIEMMAKESNPHKLNFQMQMTKYL